MNAAGLPRKKTAFLKAYAVCGRISRAARAVKIERDMHYRWMKDDPDYPAAFEEAKKKAVQAWEDEAVKRATRGVFEPLSYQGHFVYPVVGFQLMFSCECGRLTIKSPATSCPDCGRPVNPERAKEDPERPIFSKRPYGVRKVSDRLLEFLLRGAKPDTYRDRAAVELTGAGGGPIELVERLNAGRARLAKQNEPETPES